MTPEAPQEIMERYSRDFAAKIAELYRKSAPPPAGTAWQLVIDDPEPERDHWIVVAWLKAVPVEGGTP